jgi:MFS family permease
MADSKQNSLTDFKIPNVILFIALAGFLYGNSIGINLISLPLFLNNLGFYKADIAYILSFEMVAIFFAAPFLQNIINYFGFFKTIIVSLIVRNIFLLMLGCSQSKFIILLNIFIFGIGGYVLFACFQVWVNQITNLYNRGKSFGVLNAAFALGTACGPVILNIAQISPGPHSILTSVIIASFIIIPVSLIKFSMPRFKASSDIPFNKLLNIVQIPVMCGFIVEFVFYGIGDFIVLFGISHGLSQAEAILLVSYMVFSSVIFDIPVGYIVDKINRQNLIIIFTIIALIAFQLIPYVILNKPQTIALFALISSSVSGIYICGMSLLGDKFQGSDLVAANSLLSIMNAAGAFSGIAFTGIAIDYFGDDGLIISLTLTFAIFLIFNILSLIKK